MKPKTIITLLGICISVFSCVAACIGIFSDKVSPIQEVISVRGEKIILYGKGAYHDMSLQVAPQGIAQDVVTLFVAIPLLILSLFLYRKDSVQGKILLAGTLGYFMVTYLFFTLMAMYNQLFLLWLVILSMSFFSFIIVFTSIKTDEISFKKQLPVGFVGGFLIFNAVSIAILWLSIVLPPAFQGKVPVETEHYTTLVVQALDLAILLPTCFIGGYLLIRKKSFGFVLAPVYVVFLSILMLALTAKVIAMGVLGYAIIPVVFIIPSFTIITLVCLYIILKRINPNYNYHEIYCTV